MHRRRAAALVVSATSAIVLLVSALPASAQAMPTKFVTPSHSQKAAIVASLYGAEAHAKCYRVSVTTHPSGWGTVRHTAESGCAVSDGWLVIKRMPDRSWKLLDIGGSMVSCIPLGKELAKSGGGAAVLREFRRDGACEPGDAL